jgi:hypothetical protein
MNGAKSSALRKTATPKAQRLKPKALPEPAMIRAFKVSFAVTITGLGEGRALARKKDT